MRQYYAKKYDTNMLKIVSQSQADYLGVRKLGVFHTHFYNTMIKSNVIAENNEWQYVRDSTVNSGHKGRP